MKILLALQSSNVSGISYYRQLMPHAFLKTLNAEVEIEQVRGATYANIMALGEDKLKEFQIAVLTREVDAQGTGVKLIKKLQSLGVKVVLDVDDYWELPSGHKLKQMYSQLNIPQLMINNIMEADYVTCTNKFLASKIKAYNDKVMVLPNFVDKNQPQFKRMDIPSERTRFGWIGGVYHTGDIAPMERSFEKLWRDKSIKDKWSISLGGFTLNSDRKFIENIFTAGYKYLDYDYAQYLKAFTSVAEHTMYNQTYKRIWSLDVFNYITMYNQLDVSLVPLRNNEFNNCKSELKIIEAGAMGKAVIVNDCYPYNEICNTQNSLMIGHDTPHRAWYQAMKLCITEPNLVKDLSAQLTIDCDNKFNPVNITSERKQLYQWLTK